MNDYLLIFRGGGMEKEISKEEMQSRMLLWNDWISKLNSKGLFVGGDPLEIGGNIISKSKAGVISTDGPFPESKELVGGYLLIRAANQAQAVELSKDCPLLEFEGTVEVRQITPMEYN